MIIKIVTVPHTLFAATILLSTLKSLKYKAEIVKQIDYSDASLYIIYNAASIGRMPRNYIVMQTEIKNSHWFSENYFNIIRKAKAVWDYSADNILAYTGLNDNICLVTPGINRQMTGKKDIDYLFYGWLEGSIRRNRIIEEIKKQIPLLVITNKLGPEMWHLLNRARVVINIHYYRESPLELFRINESLSHCCNVISEGFETKYFTTVSFRNTADEIVECAVEEVTREFNYDLSTLNNTKEIINGLTVAGI